MSVCRSGCREGTHVSYGDCLRSARVRVGSAVDFKSVMSELDAYVDARRQGVQPASTARDSTEYAMARSDHAGVAFDAAVSV